MESRVIDQGSLIKYMAMVPNTVIRGKKSRDLSIHAKWLYVYLKSVAGEYGICLRSTTTMVEETGMGRASVSRAKSELLKNGLIVIKPGNNPRRHTDHISIKDIWLINMQEFSVPIGNTDDIVPSVDTQGEDCGGVPIGNTAEIQCSNREHPVPIGNSILRRSPQEEKEKEVTTFLPPTEEAAGAATSAGRGPTDNDVAVATKPRSHKKPIAPLAPDDWLYVALLDYQEEFDIPALNDDRWWTNFANSFPEWNSTWVCGALANLAQWLDSHQRERPRTSAGWKNRVRISFNYFYDYVWLKRTRSGKAASR